MGARKRAVKKKKTLPPDFEEQVIANLIKMRKLQREALIKIMCSIEPKPDFDKKLNK